MLNRIPVPAVFDAGEGEHGLDLREILSFVWRQWKFILGVTGVVLVIGIVSLLRQTPLYTATAQVLLQRPSRSLPRTRRRSARRSTPRAAIDSSAVTTR
jgi:uncharacterized protein involved in exopolysaccharide biosynthesis